MKRNTPKNLISVVAVLGLAGLGTWISLDRGTPQPAAQLAQGVPLDSPLVAQPVDPTFVPLIPFTGTFPVIPRVEPPPQPTFDYDSVVYSPTATLTQKEEVIFDPVNGITITLPAGFFARPSPLQYRADMRIQNFDLGEDPRLNPPENWIGVSIGVGAISDQDTFEEFVTTRLQWEKEALIGTDYRYEALKPFTLGAYQGYSYDAAGSLEFNRYFTGTRFIKGRVLLLTLDQNRFAQINIVNIDSSDFGKLMKSINTIEFAPASSDNMPPTQMPASTQFAVINVSTWTPTPISIPILSPTPTLDFHG